MAREEYNLPLNEEAYNHLVSKCDGHIIKKTRYIIPIDLCNVASGRVGLYFEQSLCQWDYAAGFLLVKEAAAYVHL